jgi:hypothetical protein
MQVLQQAYVARTGRVYDLVLHSGASLRRESVKSTDLMSSPGGISFPKAGIPIHRRSSGSWMSSMVHEGSRLPLAPLRPAHLEPRISDMVGDGGGLRSGTVRSASHRLRHFSHKRLFIFVIIIALLHGRSQGFSASLAPIA